MQNFDLFIGAIIIYLYGSIPFPYLLGKLRGIDISKVGSKNIGTTNLTRLTGSKKYAIISGFLDGTKGFLGGLIALLVGLPIGFGYLLASFGQMYSIFLYFLTNKIQGGKAVAGTFGFVIIYGLSYGSLWPIILFTLVFLLLARFTHYISIASTFSLWFFVLLTIINGDYNLTFWAIIITFLSMYKHRANYQLIKSGKERKVWLKK